MGHSQQIIPFIPLGRRQVREAVAEGSPVWALCTSQDQNAVPQAPSLSLGVLGPASPTGSPSVLGPAYSTGSPSVC